MSEIAGMWIHDCPVEGQICIGLGEPCPWCGMTEKAGSLGNEHMAEKDRE